jgi:hypothetical protein
MKRISLAFIVAAVLCVTIHAQITGSFESLTVAATSVGLASGTKEPGGVGTGYSTSCVGQLETATVRVRMDGTAPTTSVGVLLNVGDVIALRNVHDIDAFRGIRTGGTSGTIPFTCSVNTLQGGKHDHACGHGRRHVADGRRADVSAQ